MQLGADRGRSLLCSHASTHASRLSSRSSSRSSGETGAQHEQQCVLSFVKYLRQLRVRLRVRVLSSCAGVVCTFMHATHADLASVSSSDTIEHASFVVAVLASVFVCPGNTCQLPGRCQSTCHRSNRAALFGMVAHVPPLAVPKHLPEDGSNGTEKNRQSKPMCRAEPAAQLTDSRRDTNGSKGSEQGACNAAQAHND